MFGRGQGHLPKVEGLHDIHSGVANLNGRIDINSTPGKDGSISMEGVIAKQKRN